MTNQTEDYLLRRLSQTTSSAASTPAVGQPARPVTRVTNAAHAAVGKCPCRSRCRRGRIDGARRPVPIGCYDPSGSGQPRRDDALGSRATTGCAALHLGPHVGDVFLARSIAGRSMLVLLSRVYMRVESRRLIQSYVPFSRDRYLVSSLYRARNSCSILLSRR